MIEFLAQMPTDTKIFLTMAVLVGDNADSAETDLDAVIGPAPRAMKVAVPR
jgi:hypothetical protein